VEDRFSVAEDLRRLAVELGVYMVREASRLIDLAVELLYRAIKENIKKKIALLADDVFQKAIDEEQYFENLNRLGVRGERDI